MFNLKRIERNTMSYSFEHTTTNDRLQFLTRSSKQLFTNYITTSSKTSLSKRKDLL